MKSKVVRLYGKNDLRLEEIELPEIKDNEILASVVTDSICMSTWKLANQGEEHKKTPKNLIDNPIIIGHEFCGDILEVGEKWKSKFLPGQKYVVQANLQLQDKPYCPGYSYQYTGGGATHIIIHPDVMQQDCLITYEGNSYFEGSLVEPLSCVIGAFNANFHLKQGTYEHLMGIKENGNLIIIGGTGPMGLIALDYAMNGDKKPKNIVITDIEQSKLDRAKKLYQKNNEINLYFVNTKDSKSISKTLIDVLGEKYDDIFVMVPNKAVLEEAGKIMAFDGCINFFAGPQDKNFSAEINYYNVHYNFTHYVGTSGGNIDDVKEAIKLVENGSINLAKVVTHILGLDSLVETTLKQPEIGGGKKVVYTGKKIKLTQIEEILKGEDDLSKILNKNKGLWSKEAEDYVLNNFKNI